MNVINEIVVNTYCEWKTIWAQLLFLKEIIRYKGYMKSVKFHDDGIRWIKLLDKI